MIGATNSSVDCSQISLLPDLHFDFGSGNFSVSADNYINSTPIQGQTTKCKSCDLISQGTWFNNMNIDILLGKQHRYEDTSPLEMLPH